MNADGYGKLAWDNATLSEVELKNGECGLSDGSSEGDWRLPTIEELEGIGTDPPTKLASDYPLVTWTVPEIPYARAVSVLL